MCGKYVLRCLECGKEVPDRYTNRCPGGCSGLIRAYYQKKHLTIRDLAGIFKFSDWLPVGGSLTVGAAPVSYQSNALAQELGLSNLFISFSGYWPERGAEICSCSFKELEALPTVVRMRERGTGLLQVSSAGNTGRAFARISALTGMPVIVVVPASSADSIWTTEQAENVCLVTVDGDYSDAMEFGNQVCTLEGIIAEGGARNVARRDGMGTVMLDGALTIGRLPEYYFQAVGSGTGGIAAWEAAERLIWDERFGSSLPCLHLSQNEPFTPMVHAWNERRASILPETDMPDAAASIADVYAKVLTNRNPPFSICGGVYDALAATGGRMAAITNAEAKSAEKIFVDLEGIDPDPAASVCVASLIKAVETGSVDRNATILLNITGGGYERVRENYALQKITPYLAVRSGTTVDEVRDDIKEWVNSHA